MKISGSAHVQIVGFLMWQLNILVDVKEENHMSRDARKPVFGVSDQVRQSGLYSHRGLKFWL